jgi:hypothetical protein
VESVLVNIAQNFGKFNKLEYFVKVFQDISKNRITFKSVSVNLSKQKKSSGGVIAGLPIRLK